MIIFVQNVVLSIITSLHSPKIVIQSSPPPIYKLENENDIWYFRQLISIRFTI